MPPVRPNLKKTRRNPNQSEASRFENENGDERG